MKYGFLLIMALLAAAPPAQAARVLIVTTSHSELMGTGKKTGVWLEELTTPYYLLKDAGHEVSIASIRGGNIPVDPRSEGGKEPSVLRFQADAALKEAMRHSQPLAHMNAGDFDAVFLPGGHGVMWDFPGNVELELLLQAIDAKGGVIAAVCHGPVALRDLDLSGGGYWVTGRRMTAFSDAEEKELGLFDILPFPLEGALRVMRAKVEVGPKGKPHVVRDGNLITGQNPASSEGVAKEMVKALK